MHSIVGTRKQSSKRPDKNWLATWNPHVQLGRSGLPSQRFESRLPLTNLLSQLAPDPFLFIYRAGLGDDRPDGKLPFVIFASAWPPPDGGRPCPAVGLAFATATSYWLTFVTFLSAICWLTCLLWLVAEFTQKPSWLRALGLAFATYSLLMTAYPQISILCLYTITAFSLIRVLQMSADLRTKLRITFALLACATAGALASLPVYLDLLSVARSSARLSNVSDSFFLGVLPPHHRLPELADFVVTIFDWSWLGNAIDPKYPLAFNGLSFTPVYGSLIWLSLFLKPRRSVLFWQLLVAICLVGTIWPAAYLFAVHHLGFRLSRLQLLIGGIVPGFVLSAFVVDAVLREKLRLTIRSTMWTLLPLVMEVAVASLNWKWSSIDRGAVGITFLLVIALLGAIHYRSKATFIAIALISVVCYGRPLILSRTPETIHLSSKLVDAIKAATQSGSRFAIADSAISALPPNEEALLGLMSLNSYDSLSSHQYQELTSHWSTSRDRSYGRFFRFLNVKSAFKDQAFSLSNVEVILSRRPLEMEGSVPVTDAAGIKLYRPPAIPIGLRQTSHFRLFDRNHSIIDISPEFPAPKAQRLELLNDFQRIEVTSCAQETLLFLSQQYHRAWQATSRLRQLRTVRVNNFYQGVIIPPLTSEVELSFKPLVLWSWVPQFFFVSAGAVLSLSALWRLRRGHVMHDNI